MNQHKINQHIQNIKKEGSVVDKNIKNLYLKLIIGVDTKSLTLFPTFSLTMSYFTPATIIS